MFPLVNQFLPPFHWFLIPLSWSLFWNIESNFHVFFVLVIFFSLIRLLHTRSKFSTELVSEAQQLYILVLGSSFCACFCSTLSPHFTCSIVVLGPFWLHSVLVSTSFFALCSNHSVYYCGHMSAFYWSAQLLDTLARCFLCLHCGHFSSVESDLSQKYLNVELKVVRFRILWWWSFMS